MSMARKMKRKQLKTIIGKCRRCHYAYNEILKERCDRCQASGEYINFKRKVK